MHFTPPWGKILTNYRISYVPQEAADTGEWAGKEGVWWVGHRQQWSPHCHLLTHSFLQDEAEKQQGETMWKTPMGWHKSLVVNKKNISDAKATTLLLPLTDQCPASFWATATLKETSCPQPGFIAECGAACPFYHLGQLSSPPTLLHGWWGRAEWETEAALMLCNHSSVTAETVVCCQHWFGHKHSTERAPVERADSILARANTGHEMQFGTSLSWLYCWTSEGANAVSKVSEELSLACSDSFSLPVDEAAE